MMSSGEARPGPAEPRLKPRPHLQAALLDTGGALTPAGGWWQCPEDRCSSSSPRTGRSNTSATRPGSLAGLLTHPALPCFPLPALAWSPPPITCTHRAKCCACSDPLTLTTGLWRSPRGHRHRGYIPCPRSRGKTDLHAMPFQSPSPSPPTGTSHLAYTFPRGRPLPFSPISQTSSAVPSRSLDSYRPHQMPPLSYAHSVLLPSSYVLGVSGPSVQWSVP